MQRGPYGQPGPAQSPPLHHPVPQHVSTVPQLRSPPPLSQSQNSYGYSAQQNGAYGQQAFTGLMTDPTAQMGFQVGQSAVMAGQAYVSQNLGRYANVSAIKHYFNVSNSYVVNKLFLILCPWRHKPWTRRQAMSADGQSTMFMPPRDDINSPDMYIPVMAFVTYILLSAVLAGFRGVFHPQLFGITATATFLTLVLEVGALKLVCYLLSISNDSQLLDLVAYSGYKFVGVIVTIVIAEICNGGRGTGGMVGWAVFAYTFSALAFFLLRSMKYVILPENFQGAAGSAMETVTRQRRNSRTQFLFAYAFVVQLVLMWYLTREEGRKIPGTIA